MLWRGPASELVPESWTENSVLNFGEQFYAGKQFVVRGATGGRGSVVRDRLGAPSPWQQRSGYMRRPSVGYMTGGEFAEVRR